MISASPLFRPLHLAPPDPEEVVPAEFRSLPSGDQIYWGIPFSLRDSPLVCGTNPIQLDLEDDQASYLVVAHACQPAPTGTRLGEHLGEYVLESVDGTESVQPIRRRFEIDVAHFDSFDLPFAARPSRMVHRLEDSGLPVSAAAYAKTGVVQEAFQNRAAPLWWIYALPNPWPDGRLRRVRITARTPGTVAIGGLTLFYGREHPLRHRPARIVRVPLSRPVPPDEVEVQVDLGLVGRHVRLMPDPAETWLGQPYTEWGRCGLEPAEPAEVVAFISSSCTDPPLDSATSVAIEIAATADATVSAQGRQYAIADLEVLDPEPAWIEGRVIDSATGRPTAARLHMHTSNGVYVAPYGHHRDVSIWWADDQAADLKLNDTPFAYVGGSFRVQLPPGPVFVEVHKGFEYEPMRLQLEVRPGQPLEIPIRRRFESGPSWMTSDTHVHFLSPHTALLEAEAEDVHLVNLLAAQWGNLLSNVGDLGWGEAVRRGDRSVWMGTENRQHILGHLGLLGTGADPVEPFSAAGVIESGIGDPAWVSMAEWATLCRERGGLAVAAHFPLPYGEVSADIVLGKLDAVELRTFGPSAEVAELVTWYRHLNVGHRIPCVGGTDKMWSVMPIGDVRTYAQIGSAQPGFHSFAAAVRAGRTFVTTGPFLDLSVDGQGPGATIALPAGGGVVEVNVRVQSAVPFDAIELVCNGAVVADTREGTTLRARVPVSSGSWVAARVLGPGFRRCNGWPSGIGAHTSPVYLTVGGHGPFQPAAAAELMASIEGALLWVDTLATVASTHAHERLRRVFIEARERLSAS